ncbi:hypothetical protein KM043_001777 [Ampulex compressa]|nr:hypothetical protein KM043_001777 [Ampulex compressa]
MAVAAIAQASKLPALAKFEERKQKRNSISERGSLCVSSRAKGEARWVGGQEVRARGVYVYATELAPCGYFRPSCLLIVYFLGRERYGETRMGAGSGIRAKEGPPFGWTGEDS